MNKPIKLTNKEAKRVMKMFNLKWTWDKEFEFSDIQCFCGEWFSNPWHGMVKRENVSVKTNKDGHSAIKAGNKEFLVEKRMFEKASKKGYAVMQKNALPSAFSDKMKNDIEVFKKVPDKGATKWFLKTFLNKKEFEEWKNKVVDNSKLESFENYWKNYSFGNLKYPNLITGHSWRNKEDGKIIGNFEKSQCPNGRKWEKVVSLGYYGTPNPMLEKCPICEIVHSIGYWENRLPLRYKIKEFWEFIKMARSETNE